MRWLTFIVLLYIAATLQVSGLLSIPHAGSEYPWPRIEYVVVLVVFYSLFAGDHESPLAGLAAGFALDLVGHDVMGTSTLAMGLTALAIVKIRLSIFREQAFSQMLVTFLAVAVFGVLTGFLRSIGPMDKQSILSFLGAMLSNAAYSGLLAPVFFWILFRMRPALGFGTHGPRSR